MAKTQSLQLWGCKLSHCIFLAKVILKFGCQYSHGLVSREFTAQRSGDIKIRRKLTGEEKIGTFNNV